MKGTKTKSPNAFLGFDVPTIQNIPHTNSTDIQAQIEQAVVLRSLVLFLISIPEIRGISVIVYFDYKFMRMAIDHEYVSAY
jgi:hypothetical protein